MARSYRTHYRLVEDGDFYIKKQFEFTGFRGSRFSSNVENMLVRIQNTFASSLNKCKYLPKYMVVVPDDDLITYLGCKNEDGIATLLGRWMEWLVDEIQELIKKKKSLLPAKACRDSYPFIYWVAAPLHHYFSKDRNALRVKFNLSMDSVVRAQKNMRIVTMKEFWEPKNSALVINDRMTETGLYFYWKAVDATVQFNIQCREAYLLKRGNGGKSLDPQGDQAAPEDLMKTFF